MIARTRKRARQRSSSLRTLGWLIRREAAFCIVVGNESPIIAPRARRTWALITTREADARARRALVALPHRRFQP